MAKKGTTTFRGYLIADDVNSHDKDDKEFWEYWNRINDTLYVIGSSEAKEVTFLNKELKRVAKKYEGQFVKITIEPDTPPAPGGPRKGKMPDPNEMYTGAEKFKRLLFNQFKIS